MTVRVAYELWYLVIDIEYVKSVNAKLYNDGLLKEARENGRQVPQRRR